MEPPAVRYVQTSDGYSIAFAVTGSGQPVVWMPHLFSHLELYWKEDTFIRRWLEALASRFQLIQYDGRGQGMSTRGLPPDMTLAQPALDLEAVVERLQLKDLVLIAVGWAGHVAIHYASQNPGRVKALVLEACPIRGAGYEMTVFDELASRDWDRFIRTIAALGQPQQVSDSVNRLRQTATQEDHSALARAWMKSDIKDLLPTIDVPTLVLHPRDYFSLPVEAAIELAAGLSHSHLVITDGATAPGDAEQSAAAIETFLAGLKPTKVPAGEVSDSSSPLSEREVEVLRLLAAGLTNQQIATGLVISPNTVGRHISNIFAKIGAANRAEAAVYAQRHGML
jgi:pimeloyl-ACP methyl ester carboxylesterase/DNA-binding CsgD family transcriptional regulator